MSPTDLVVAAAVFVVLAGSLAIGIPVAVGIGLAALAGLLVAVPPDAAFTTVAQRMASGLDSFALLAIPFFILAGHLAHRGGLARRLVALAQVVVGPLPGGLASVNVLASMLFGAISGSAVASASAIGTVMGPQLERAGWKREEAAAINIAAATTGLVIPPSNVLIVYSLASGGVSIAALFAAGYLPGILVGLAIMAVAAVRAERGGLPRGSFVAAGELARRALAALPALGMIVVVVGGILAGVVTATEAAALAVVYILVVALATRELRLRELPSILAASASTTGVVLLLVGASMAFAWVLAWTGAPSALASALIGLGGGKLGLLVTLNIALLLLGTFLDMTPAVLLVTPIVLPAATALGIDPVHFGIILVVNLCVGLCTPPVGSVLFVGCGVAGTTIGRVVPHLVPYWIVMIVALAAISWWPWLSLWWRPG